MKKLMFVAIVLVSMLISCDTRRKTYILAPSTPDTVYISAPADTCPRHPHGHGH